MNAQKLTIKDFILLIAPVGVGICCLLLWWYELHQLIGWQGMKWLKAPLTAVYVITALVVLVFLLPMLVELKMTVPWLILYSLLLYGASLVAFFTAKKIFYTLYTKGLIINDHHTIALSIWKLMGVVIGLSAIYFIPMRHFHKTTDGMHILTIIVAIISVVPASLISVESLPLWSSKMAFIDAVKLGYPIFWISIFLGLLSTAAAKEWI